MKLLNLLNTERKQGFMNCLLFHSDVMTSAPRGHKIDEIPKESTEQLVPRKGFSIGQFQIEKEHKVM